MFTLLLPLASHHPVSCQHKSGSLQDQDIIHLSCLIEGIPWSGWRNLVLTINSSKSMVEHCLLLVTTCLAEALICEHVSQGNHCLTVCCIRKVAKASKSIWWEDVEWNVRKYHQNTQQKQGWGRYSQTWLLDQWTHLNRQIFTPRVR